MSQLNKESFNNEWNKLKNDPRPHPVLDRDFVNTKKPSALKVFWNRHGDSVRFWVIVGLIILVGGVS